MVYQVFFYLKNIAFLPCTWYNFINTEEMEKYNERK